MLRLDGWAFGEIGNRPRNFQDTVVRTGAKTQLRDGNPQQFLRSVLNFAKLAEVAGFHIGIAEDFRLRKPPLLAATRFLYPFADACRGFTGEVACQIFVLDGGNFDLQINPIQQGSRNPGDVILDLLRRTSTVAAWVAKIATGTSIQSECTKHRASRCRLKYHGTANHERLEH